MHAFPRHARYVVDDRTVRTHGPIMFIGDSTSAKQYRAIRRDFSKAKIGPYRVDLNLARSISRDGKWRPSAITAVREARAAGFDPPSYVIALGFPDILGGNMDKRFLKDPTGTTVSMLEPLMAEIGPDRTVGFLNLYGTYSSKSSRAKQFNIGLKAAAERWPNLVIIDWASLARRNRWWHKVDGFHYGYRGSIERQRFVVKALIDIATLAATNPTTTQTESTAHVSAP
jgi:hypothetical protein